jgi:polysaccharide biosynthesis protein PslH
MRLLFVTPYLPSPPRFGGERRLDGLMREVAREHDVSLLSLVDPAEDSAGRIAEALGFCRTVRVVPHAASVAQGFRKRALQAGSFLSPFSFERVAYNSPGLRRSLIEMTKGGGIDLVQFEFVHCALAGEWPSPRVPRVLDEHNIEYDIVKRTASASASFARRAYSGANWRKLRVEEIRAWRHFDGCTFTSERDRQLSSADVPNLKSTVVPNGVDTLHFAPDATANAEPDSILFFGALNYYPNIEGLLFFLREVLPELRKRRPLVRFRIVGQKPPPEIRAWRDPAVDLVGYVDDVRPYIASAAAVVVPLRIGGGTRLKVLEAMAMGKPVVSTTLGVEGIDVVHGRDVLIGNRPDELADQLARVLESRNLSREIGTAARELAEIGYSWRASAKRLLEFHSDLLASPRPS